MQSDLCACTAFARLITSSLIFRSIRIIRIMKRHARLCTEESAMSGAIT